MKRNNKSHLFLLSALVFVILLISTGCLASLLPNNTEKSNTNDQSTVKSSSNKPVIGIIYTMTSQNYKPSQPFTSEDLGDITKVGAVLNEALTSTGINSINDFTLHDRPVFNQAYDKSQETINKLTQSYPDLKLILDLRRDAIPTNRPKNYTTVDLPDGKTAAKLLFVVNKNNEQNKESSFSAAQFISDELNKLVPNISRGVTTGDKNIVNFDQSIPMITIFIGDYERNNLEQAQETAQLLSGALANWLANQ